MSAPQQSKRPVKKPEIELHPDAWPRFERFIKQVAKAGPRHRSTAPKKAKATSASKTK